VAGYLYDSFYNFAWMPINFRTGDKADPKDIHKGQLRVSPKLENISLEFFHPMSFKEKGFQTFASAWDIWRFR
jgi:hypothetical protein